MSNTPLLKSNILCSASRNRRDLLHPIYLNYSPAIYTDTKPETGGSLLSATINNNCVGCWIFNEGTGTTAHDLSTSAKNGVLTGNTTWDTDDKGMPCVIFDGIDGEVDVDHWGTVAPNSAMTFLLRQKCTSTSAGDVSFRCVNGSGNMINAHVPFSDGTVYWDAGDQTSKRISYNPGAVTGVWNTWIFVVAASGSSNSNIYLNGVLGHSGTITPGFSGDDSPLYIGGSGAGATFSGKIDTMRVWSRALTFDEIATLSAAPYTGIGN